jgi:hypothetical protein
VVIRAKKIFLSKIQFGYKKNAEFHTDFESVEKVFKKCTNKKLLVTEICTFLTFTHVRQTCVAYNFFLAHLPTNFSMDSKSA